MDDYAKQSKKLSIVAVLLLIIVAAIVLLSYFFEYGRATKVDDYNQQLISQANEFNNTINFFNAKGVSGQSEQMDNSKNDVALFSDGKTAFLYAYSKLINYTSYTLKSNGITTSSQVGFDKKVASYVEYYKYSNNECINIVSKYELPSTINLNLSNAEYDYFCDNKCYYKTTKNIKYSNGVITPIFSNTSFSQKSNSNIPNPLCYTITNDSISKSLSFNTIKGSDGKIKYYDFSIELDCKLAVLSYSNKIKQEAGASGLPSFSQIKLSVMLDNCGNFMTIKVSEKYSLKINALITANCSGELTYNYSDYNMTPSYEKPFV